MCWIEKNTIKLIKQTIFNEIKEVKLAHTLSLSFCALSPFVVLKSKTVLS